MYVGSISRSMSFSEAVNFYLNWRSAPVASGRRIQFVGKRTLKDYRQKAKALEKFFGAMKLEDIKYKNLSGYQEARLTANGYTRFHGEREVASPAGANKINSELSFLKRLMEMAGCWTPELEMYYDPFQEVEPDEQKALDPEQQEAFLQTAASLPRWHSVWWYALVAMHVTFSSDEMRTLRLGDIHLHHQTISVNNNYGKNSSRRRTVAIEDGACLWALQRLMERAQQLCATADQYKGEQPHYFLFPRCVVRNLYNPELPMGENGLRILFEEVRKAAGLPWFHFNAFRHTGATRFAESGMPPYILQQRMGHVGPKKMRYYVQISEQAQRMAVRTACAKKPVVSIKRDEVRDWRTA
jgi:integrase